MDFRLPALLVCGLLLGFGDLPAQQQSTATTARSKGSPRAPVTVYEMSDFQCPYCRSFALETFRALEKEYISPGKVRWVFVNFPLTSIHANAVAAAGTALCAGKQDAFWPVHDLLYTYQDTWAPLKEPGLPPGARLGIRREDPPRADLEIAKKKGPLLAAPPGKCRLGIVVQLYFSSRRRPLTL